VTNTFWATRGLPQSLGHFMLLLCTGPRAVAKSAKSDFDLTYTVSKGKIEHMKIYKSSKVSISLSLSLVILHLSN
jgi:hypothetical protein